MTGFTKIAAGLIALGALTACAETSGGSGGKSTSAATPSPAAQACLRDVSRSINNGDVTLLSESFSQAGTEVVVGVGPNRAPWRCIGYSDGTTGDIMSLTDEGAA